MSNITTLQGLYKNLTDMVGELVDACLGQESAFVGYRVSPIERDETTSEGKDTKQRPKLSPRQIDVDVLDQWQHRAICLSAWQEFKSLPNQDTKYVARWPGLVVVSDNTEVIRHKIQYINNAKDDIANFVQQPLNHEESKQLGRKHRRTTSEKHEFIHSALPRVMTEQLYRHIHIIDEYVTHAWFNWVRRPVPRTLDYEQTKVLLDKHLAKAEETGSDQLTIEQLKSALMEIKKNKYYYFQVRKQSLPIPTMVYQTRELIDDEWVTKRYTRNANIPFVLMGQPNNALPKVSNLETYIPRNTNPKPVKDKEIILPWLNLYGSTKPIPKKKTSKQEATA